MFASRTIEGQQPGPHLLITGGVHGDEFEPMAALRQLARELKTLEFRGRVTLIPCVNEPAFRRGARMADDGLDLARVCPGQADGSVTETIAHALSQQIHAADYYIDLHTGGVRYHVIPMTGYTLHADSAILETQRKMARAFGLPIIWGTDPNLQGRSLSVARDAGVPAIYAEYEGGRGGFNPAGVSAYVRGCVNVMAALGMCERETAPECEPLIVEDARPQSGHMQACHPAPMDGFFEPAVQPGQRVTVGDLLGTLTDMLGDHIHEIRSTATGIVLTLHMFASVRMNEGLVVVVETV